LSGGQKQRIVIARSIISDPRVLLFDETTSALDPNAEQNVQEALNNVAKDHSMVIIAHRLSTTRGAHNIVVMSKGQVIEQGRHDQLVELGGSYSRLVRAQDLGDDSIGTYVKMNDQERCVVDLDLTAAKSANTQPCVGESREEVFRYGLLQGLSAISWSKSPFGDLQLSSPHAPLWQVRFTGAILRI
jgi:ATP-binding cassette, subfamily B (MDR/TAP), member 1